MRLIYVTDLHGDEQKYERTMQIAKDKKIDIIINGGDMLPKTGDRHRKQLKFNMGFLPDYFSELQRNGIRYMGMLGNDDLLTADGWFDEVCSGFENVYNMEDRLVALDGYEFIGMNRILDHPFGCKDRVVTEAAYIRQDQLCSFATITGGQYFETTDDWFEYASSALPHMRDILENLPKPTNPDKAIYIMHMPPAGLRLGQLRSQDMDIGSVDIYDFLKKEQPLLSLHGHIHEAPDTQKGCWINQIGKATCVQPGQTELHDDYLVYVEADLAKKEYERKVAKV